MTERLHRPLQKLNLPRVALYVKKTSSQLNQTPSEDTFFEEAYEYGLSPLHTRIRFMEHILKLGYDLDFGPNGETVRNNSDNHAKRDQKKKLIQQKYLELGLIIDQPKQGEGNSNDGNTARRFFSDPETAASITGVDFELINRFKIIVQVLSCNRKISPKKFGIYASATATFYNEKYGWRHMPSTVHKVLYHGEKIIEHNMLPIGDLSEEAQEKRNKDYRYFREHNTRKMSRCNTNEDLLNILLCTSDPYISSIRHKWKSTQIELDKEAMQLLEDENQEYLDDIFTLNKNNN